MRIADVILKTPMIVASVGTSSDIDSYRAGRDACEQALEGMPARKADALLVFGSISFDQDKLLEGVSAAAPETIMVGCSTSGEISSEGLSSSQSVVVMALHGDQLKFISGIGNHILWNPRQAGVECALVLTKQAEGPIASCLTFTDSISGDGDATLDGFFDTMEEHFFAYGGAAGDDSLFFQTYQYYNGKAYVGSLVGLGLVGDCAIGGSLMHGFLPIGLARKVTRVEGTLLAELDGKPSSLIYKEYFGEKYLHELHKGLLTTLAVAYPLGVFIPEHDNVILRHPLYVNKGGGMTLTSTVPDGAAVRIMISDIERTLETATDAAETALRGLNGRTPKAIVVVSSVARKKMLGLRADEETQAIQKVFGRDVPIVGFYSYAQIGGAKGDQSAFQNGSILIWVIAE